MQKIIIALFLITGICINCFSQEIPKLSLKNSESNYNTGVFEKKNSLPNSIAQPKKRKTVTSYFGAGYSLVIFTNSELNSTYPVFDTRTGNFLSNFTLFFGFSIAKAVTLEIEPSLLFSNSNKSLKQYLSKPHTTGSNDTVAYSTNLGLFSIPIAANVRFFPFYKMEKSFARLFFIGGGAGMIWIKEDYENFYSYDPNLYIGGYYGSGGISESNSQWAPLFRAMIGFTGAGGQFGFGGELRYNIIPLKQDLTTPFKTRIAKNFNSVDLALRFYFSL